MDKTKQQALTHWLKQQSGPAKKWLRVLMALGILNGLTIIVQAWLFAYVLNALIIEHTGRELLTVYFLGLIATISVRALLAWIRERVSFLCGEAVRKSIRRSVLEKLDDLGPIWIKGKPAGSWATIIIEQIENMQDFYSRYLPQMALAGIIPLLILIAIFPINWAAGLILFITAPLIPLFMALVGNGAAEANRKNFTALARLSGNFLDRLRGIDTLRLFYQGKNEVKQIENAASDFRIRTMDVLKLAFLSSALLEFFTSVSIAVVAVYFGFSYLGDLNFGHYGTGITLFAGFLVLILAPEFFQPLRDLGTFYHAKAQAVGAAETLVDFLLYENKLPQRDREAIAEFETLHIEAHELVIFSPDGSVLAGPLSFTISNKEKIAIVGHSGAGKSSLLNVLLGFLSYQGSLKANGVEIREINLQSWRRQIAWVGQNPYLPELTIKDNILLNNPNASEQQLKTAVDKAYVNEFLARLPEGLDTKIGEYAARLSVGQAQRVAVARALLMPCHLLLLDEPTASLDANSEALVMRALNAAMQLQTTITITHRLKELTDYSTIWVMDKGVIVQSGNYSQLSQSEGHFKQLLSHRSEAL